MARQITALAAQPGVYKVLGDAEVRGGGIAYPQTHTTVPTSFTKGRLGWLGRLVACGCEVTAIVARLARAAISPQRAPVAPAQRLARLPAPTNAGPTPTHPEPPRAARPPVKNAGATVSKTAALTRKNGHIWLDFRLPGVQTEGTGTPRVHRAPELPARRRSGVWALLALLRRQRATLAVRRTSGARNRAGGRSHEPRASGHGTPRQRAEVWADDTAA